MLGQQPKRKSMGHVIEPPSGVQVGQTFENKILVLDGLKCRQCTFKNLTFLYSGGAYDLADATFKGTIAIELHGAAENALFFTSALGSTKAQPRTLARFDSPRTMSLKNTW